MDKNAAANPQQIFHPSALISHPLSTHHLNHAHYLHRMSRCQESMFSSSDSFFASAPRFKNPFQAAFEGLQHELGGRASSFAPSPPPLVSSPLTPQSRHTQAFYSNTSTSSTAGSPAPAHGAGHRSMTKICGVCGDRAKSYHFGGISCDSCKAFFRRSVQNDAYKNFHCPYEGQCDINITSRKCCQYCRFKKCVSIGMEKSWVMTEEERLQMLKSRLEKRQRPDTEERPSASSTSSSLPGNQSNGSSSPTASSIGSHISSKSRSANSLKRLRAQYEPCTDNISQFLSESDVRTIETIINQYIRSCQEIPMNLEGFEDPDDGDNKAACNRTRQAAVRCPETCSPGTVANSNLTILSSSHRRNKITPQPPHETGDAEDDKNPRSGGDGLPERERRGDDRVAAGCPEEAGQVHPFISQAEAPGNNNKIEGWDRKTGNKTQLTRILHVLFTCIQQIASFAMRIPSFQLISVKDQEILLRGSVLEMCFIRSGFRFDPQYESWPGAGSTTFPGSNAHSSSTTQQTRQPSSSESSDLGEENWYRLKRMKLSSPRDTPIAAAVSPRPTNTSRALLSGHEMQQQQDQQQEKGKDINHTDVNNQEDFRRKFILSASDIKPFVSDEMFRKHMHFVRSIRDLDADQVTIILLSIIVLLNPDRMGLQDATIISKEQEKFLILLRSYMNWRFGEVVSPILFGKFFLKLPDLKELSEVLSECQLSLGEEEVKQVYQRLSRLSLSLSANEANANGETRSVRPSENTTSQHSTSSCSSPSLVRPWVFRIDAIPQTSKKSLSHASHSQEDDACSRSCSSSPSESIASTDGPFSPT